MGSTSINFGTRDSRPANSGMQSFISHTQISNPMIAGSNTGLNTRISDFGALEQYLGIQMRDPGNISRDTAFNVPVNGQSAPHQYSNLDKNLASTATDFQGSLLGTHAAHSLYRPIANVVSSAAAAGVQHENWGESNMGAESSSRTDTSTDIDHDDKNQNFEMEHVNASDSSDKTKEKALDQKTLRRLAQNREAARKSRLRKKAYVQQLENSRLKLTQIEQELQRARQQGVFISSVRDQSNSGSMNGASVFDAEYARWLEEQTKHINDLRTAVNIHAVDTELRPLVDIAAAHFYGIFRLKATAVKTDVFHILSGMWKTPAERCFMWIGGFRPSEILKLSMKQLEPLSEPQLNGLYNLQQSSHQAEDALSQGMDALQQTLAESLASGSCGTEGFSSGTVGNYMGQMAMAMAKLENLEGFLRQADGLRQQTLQQMHRILTTRQSARALLLINDYLSKLRALSSLWLARPRE